MGIALRFLADNLRRIIYHQPRRARPPLLPPIHGLHHQIIHLHLVEPGDPRGRELFLAEGDLRVVQDVAEVEQVGGAGAFDVVELLLIKVLEIGGNLAIPWLVNLVQLLPLLAPQFGDQFVDESINNHILHATRALQHKLEQPSQAFPRMVEQVLEPDHVRVYFLR